MISQEAYDKLMELPPRSPEENAKLGKGIILVEKIVAATQANPDDRPSAVAEVNRYYQEVIAA